MNECLSVDMCSSKNLFPFVFFFNQILSLENRLPVIIPNICSIQEFLSADIRGCCTDLSELFCHLWLRFTN